MFPAFTQDNLACRIDTPLGKDVLLLEGFQGREAVSELFRLKVQVASQQESIDFQSIVGRPATLTLTLEDGSLRYINGIVASFAQAGAGPRLVHYEAELAPWLWLLTQKRDCRIFQEKTASEIIEQVFRDGGFADFDFTQLKRTQRLRTYCVQYRESDYDFVARLMEEEGISYYFKHAKDHHLLVLTDHDLGFTESPYRPQIEYDLTRTSGLDNLFDWTTRQEVNPGEYTHTDFNFETPKLDLLASAKSLSTGFNNAALEVYDYPGCYGETDLGSDLAKLRMEAAEASALRISGRSSFRELCSGHTFELTRHYREDFNKSYLLTSVDHDLRQNLFPTSEAPTAGISMHQPIATLADLVYENSFTCFPTDVTFRPPRKTRAPRIHGVQTAFVVGPSGEEIYTEKHGRVKVQFHWDRDGKADENSSCWVRVVQSIAGKGWGAVCWPRIGQEVTVEFLEGDPDCPLVTGVVYNGQTPTPYPLPEKQTLSGIKTLSSKGGEGFNEIRFDDTKGEEQIFIHAEKNQDIRVKNDLFEEVEHDRHLIVKNDRVEQVENESHVTVDQDRFEKVGKDHHLEVLGKQAIKTTGSRSLAVEGDVIEEFKGNHSQQTSGDLYLKAMGAVIEATSGLTLKVGGSSIVLDSSGVTIKGAMVTVDGSLVKIASGPGSPPTSGSAGSIVAPSAPNVPAEADVADPGKVDEIKKDQRVRKTGKYGTVQALPFKARQEGEDEEKSWIEIELVDEEDNPVPGERYEITLPDGQTVARGTVDERGFARISGIDPGTCQISFPELDREAWEKV